MKITEMHKRFKEIGTDEKRIHSFIKEAQNHVYQRISIWLPELIKEIYMGGYEDGYDNACEDLDNGV